MLNASSIEQQLLGNIRPTAAMAAPVDETQRRHGYMRPDMRCLLCTVLSAAASFVAAPAAIMPGRCMRSALIRRKCCLMQQRTDAASCWEHPRQLALLLVT